MDPPSNRCFFVLFLLLNIGSSSSQSSDQLCIKWEKQNGPRAFVDQIYQKYGGVEVVDRSPVMMQRTDFDKLLRNLRIGTVVVQCEEGDEECINNTDNTHSLNPDARTPIQPTQKRKSPGSRRRRRRAVESEEEEEEEMRRQHAIHWRRHVNNCYKTNDFLSMHGVNASRGISEGDFLRMCPSLVQQIDNSICVHNHKKIEHEGHLPSMSETWGWGFAAITLISLCSLSVIAIIPCLNKQFYAKVMAFLVALAIGTLSGDALLHLIPHAFVEGANTATNATISEADELRQHYSQVWRAMFVLLGIYVFFVVEQCMKMKQVLCGGEKGDEEDGLDGSPRLIPEKELCVLTAEEEETDANDPSFDAAVAPSLEHSMSCRSDVHDDHGHDHDHKEGHFHADDRHHHHHHHEKNITKETRISSVAWMVIVGDGFHNFSDGLAVGAAFSASITSGVSTAIAVFCHELPHELGDFAILVQNGMTIKQAIIYNIVSAGLAYVGLVVGILAGASELGRHFILSITAGMFLYISLADMLPEMTHQKVPHSSRCAAFICQHLGMLTGIAIMLFISLYEHQM